MNKIIESIREYGVKKTVYRIYDYIKFNTNRKYHEILIFPLSSRKQVFKSIYKNNYWGSENSVSGPGSSILYTEKIRNSLPKLIDKYQINTIFDAPCGDFNWISKIIENHHIKYYGADIVEEIIVHNRSEFKIPNVTFIQMDITEDTFPADCDLWLCRDCLFHLSYKDIYKALKKYVDSGIPYILTTTHKGDYIVNKNILTGDFRSINLFTHPFSFPENCLARFDDYLPPESEREMCLWTHDQIKGILSDMRSNMSVK
jgi:hypothetical protein